jgi:hypothetical protein
MNTANSKLRDVKSQSGIGFTESKLEGLRPEQLKKDGCL